MIDQSLQERSQKIPAIAKIIVREHAGIDRVDEPVQVSVPLTAGVVDVKSQWTLVDADGKSTACQTQVLARWPDGSIQWLNCVFLATVPADAMVVYQLQTNEATDNEILSLAIRISEQKDEILVNTGNTRFQIPRSGTTLISSITCGDKSFLTPEGLKLLYSGPRIRYEAATLSCVTVEEHGPLRARVRWTGRCRRKSDLTFLARASFFGGNGLMRFELTLQNPARALHSGGYWDLGDAGSVLFRYFTLSFNSTLNEENRRIHWMEQPLGVMQQSDGEEWSICQYSSGGDAWQSRNHLNHRGVVPLEYKGYQVANGSQTMKGLRTTPVICVKQEDRSMGCAPLEFWQKFPTTVHVEEKKFDWRPFPFLGNGCHELQAGEQSTHVAWFDFSISDAVDSCQRLAGMHVPLEVRCSSEWYAQAGVVSHLPGPNVALRPELTTLLNEAITGKRNFFHKREVVDEYGWRNYGDMWGDHEEVHYPGPHRPIISHYNNQFDLLHGMLVEYLRSGDRRWWELADPLARHVMDIDIYHTTHDRAAYNGGLFWPTTHYYDAGTSTHRSMARAMKDVGTTGVGGGPGSEHNFADGLLLYYHLTGDSRARESVLGLADWVIAMDDGSQHPLGLLSAAPTGTATSTSLPDYHGPGRGPANSLQVLMCGYCASGATRYLEKAEEIIRRTSHPRDDLAALQLDNAELRWSYPMWLEALARYVDVASSVGRDDFMIEYARQTVLHYARWMAAHERNYLDQPEKLQFPTETWAAQDLRKGTALLMAAVLADNPERETFRRRGLEILDRAWQQLTSFSTRDYTRPLAIVLDQGYLEAGLTVLLKQAAPPVASANGQFDPGLPITFIPQKQVICQSLRSPIGIARMLRRFVRPAGWANLARRSWIAQRLRRSLGLVASQARSERGESM